MVRVGRLRCRSLHGTVQSLYHANIQWVFLRLECPGWNDSASLESRAGCVLGRRLACALLLAYFNATFAAYLLQMVAALRRNAPLQPLCTLQKAVQPLHIRQACNCIIVPSVQSGTKTYARCASKLLRGRTHDCSKLVTVAAVMTAQRSDKNRDHERPLPRASWVYTDGSTRPAGAWKWETAAVLVAHVFLVPLVLVVATAVIWTTLPSWRIALVTASLAYFATMFDGAQYTGRRAIAALLRPWPMCHHMFPVVTKMWSGGGKWSTVPLPVHDTIFNVEQRPHLFAVHPHGALPVGASVLLPQLSRWAAIGSRIRVGGASIVFWLPLVRDWLLAFGAVDAGRRTLERCLREGLSVVLLPGGIQEQLLDCEPHEERITLLRRKGFIDLALSTRAAVVPVYVFGA